MIYKFNFMPKKDINKIYDFVHEDETTNKYLEKLLHVKFNDVSNMTKKEFKMIVKKLKQPSVQKNIIKVIDKKVPKKLIEYYKGFAGDIDTEIISKGIKMFIMESYNNESLFNFDVKFLYDTKGRDWSTLTDTSPRELILQNIYLLCTGNKHIESDFFKFFPQETITIRLKPKITLIDIINDKEIYQGSLGKISKKYRDIVLKYLDKAHEHIFDTIFASVLMYLSFRNVDSGDTKDYSKLKMQSFKMNKNSMIYTVFVRKDQVDYYKYAIENDMDGGANAWGESDAVTINSKKAKSMKLGKLPKDIIIDIFPMLST